MKEPLADIQSSGEGISLYVHIPFCKSKCPYCDFNTYERLEALIGPLVDAVALEIRLWGKALGRPRVNTVFFGGGTPSYVPLDCLKRLMEAIGGAFDVVAGAETTVEANPGDLSGPALSRLLEIGVNRLSIGVQSLDDSLLGLLGRRHSADEAVAAYELTRQAGFQRVNLDLMYGLPGQTMAQWRSTLARVLELHPPHLSLYCLTLEPGTPMERWVRQGPLAKPDPDLAADMYTAAQEALDETGYCHYEISNWATPGFECLHNMAYWLNRSYLGVGPGAHSCLHRHRFWDVTSPRTYIQRVQDWASGGVVPLKRFGQDELSLICPVDGVEGIEPRVEMAETMFLGLRLLDGLRIEDFRRRFGCDPMELYGPQIQELGELGLLEHPDGVLRLTPQGCLLANQVFIRFLD